MRCMRGVIMLDSTTSSVHRPTPWIIVTNSSGLLTSLICISFNSFLSVCDHNNHCGSDRRQRECLFSLSRSVAGGHRICDGQYNRRRMHVADARERCGDQTGCFSQTVVHYVCQRDSSSVLTSCSVFV